MTLHEVTRYKDFREYRRWECCETCQRKWLLTGDQWVVWEAEDEKCDLCGQWIAPQEHIFFCWYKPTDRDILATKINDILLVEATEL